MTTIPALAIDLDGRYLIEASAGTGKTWTLTGILLRLLLESEFTPAQIAAVTFTRKAAAEMRSRTQLRFQAFLALCQGLADAGRDNPELFTGDIAANIGAALDSFQTENHPLKPAAEDIINRQIFLNAAEAGIDGFTQLLQRAVSRREDIDKLFIGTLDSLCQKLLQEFALETGSAGRITLLEDSSEPVQAILHRALRERLHTMNAEELAAYLDSSDCDFAKLCEAAGKGLNYPGAPLEELPPLTALPDTDKTQLQENLAVAENALASLFSRYSTAQWQTWQAELLTALEPALKKTERTHAQTNLLQPLPEIAVQAAAKNFDLLFGTAKTSLSYILDSSKYKKGQDGVLNGTEILAVLKDIAELQTAIATTQAALKKHETLLKERAAQFDAQLIRHLQEILTETLPAYLEEQSQSTFGEQMAKLNRALEGRGGEALAKAIARKLPALLVDESQDLNGAQAAFLEHVYLHRQPDGRQFLLLVGDPKQAIYGFRGGDTANYLRLKEQIPDRKELDANFRTAAPLLDALNRMYKPQPVLSEGIEYIEMTAGSVKPRSIVKADGSEITEPVQWFTSDNDSETARIAAITEALTSPASNFGRRQPDGTVTQLRRQDILIVMRGNRELRAVQELLLAKGIDTAFSADENIFTQRSARALGILMQAMLKPQDQALQNRLLSSLLFNFSSAEICAFQNASQEVQQEGQAGGFTPDILAAKLLEAGQTWRKRQFLPALQEFLSTPFAGLSIWQRLAQLPANERERPLLDLRQLQRILAEHGSTRLPESLLRWWQQMLAEPPAAGWAKCQPLPGKDAVRLMTIHSAKGLEAPVIIAGGLKGRGKIYATGLHSYHDEDNQLQLSANPKTEARKTKLREEEDEESARLLYVALTRAADLLFVGLQTSASKDKGTRPVHPPLQRLNAHEMRGTDGHALLDGEPEQLAQLLTQRVKSLPPPAGTVQAAPVLLEPYERRRFAGWQKSSFTALARGLPAAHASTELPDYAFTETEPAAALDSATPPAAYPLQFAKGTGAGSFLHELLEHLPADDAALRYHAARLARKYQLDIREDFDALKQWLDDILHSQLTSGARLADIPERARCNEMGFLLAAGTGSFPAKAVNALFAKWGHPLNLENTGQIIAFFRGEIDVCYEHAGKYYLLDYKSNYLGDRAEDYSKAAMQAGMDGHYYWLQALIYQTALHRWLKARLADYQPAQHLGAPEYFFLRGCPLADTEGHLQIEIPPDILLEFDALLPADAAAR